MLHWYLVRTKAGAERIAHDQLQHIVERIILPLAKTQLRQRARTFQRVSPIFPCYLFAFFGLAHAARQIRYTPRVRDIVRFGDQAAVVPTWVVDEPIARCADRLVDLAKPRLSRGMPEKINHGPFHAFEAIFAGYCSAAERVAVLLSIMNAERRVVMPTAWVEAR